MYSLDNIVRQVLNEQFESSPHRYARFLQFGYDCIRDELRFIFPHYLKTVRLTVNSNNTVDLPTDYVKYTKIGYENNGRIECFGLDENFLTLLDRDASGNILMGTQIETNATVPFFNFLYSGTWGTLYGYKVGNNPMGNYKIFHQNNQIAFDSLMKKTAIILEYKSSGIKSAGQELVPGEAILCIKEYIHWQYIKHKRSANLGEKTNAERLYRKSLKEARAKIFSFTENEFLSVSRRGYTQSVKG